MENIIFYQIYKRGIINNWACSEMMPMEDELFFNKDKALERIAELTKGCLGMAFIESQYINDDVDDNAMHKVLVEYTNEESYSIVEKKFKDNSENKLPF